MFNRRTNFTVLCLSALLAVACSRSDSATAIADNAAEVPLLVVLHAADGTFGMYFDFTTN